MKIKNKKYSLEQSCLYKLSNKKKLSKLLFTSYPILKGILDNGDSNYRIKIVKTEKTDRSFKSRTLQIVDKNKVLYNIQKRIAFLLTSIENEEYLFSGTKGKSYIDNSKYHLQNGNKPIVKLDIKDFFPSVKYNHVFLFFKHTMKCSVKIANIWELYT